MFSSSLKVSFHLIPILALMGLAFGIQHQGLALPFSGKKKKNPPANAGDSDVGSISGSETSPGDEMAIPSSILNWKIP